MLSNFSTSRSHQFQTRRRDMASERTPRSACGLARCPSLAISVYSSPTTFLYQYTRPNVRTTSPKCIGPVKRRRMIALRSCQGHESRARDAFPRCLLGQGAAAGRPLLLSTVHHHNGLDDDTARQDGLLRRATVDANPQPGAGGSRVARSKPYRDMSAADGMKKIGRVPRKRDNAFYEVLRIRKW